MINHDKRINNLYTCHNTACWAKGQLRILVEMIDDRITGKVNLPPLAPSFIVKELVRIANGIFVDIEALE